MRSFRDSDGKAWTVFEVRRVVSSLAGLSEAPVGLGSGWLCFENGSAKRRLLRFPERWREFSEPQLQQLLAEASPAPRTTWRIDGLDDLSPATDARG
jgi:hypothetical protein